MNLADITTKCYILALIIRDDGERLLLGDGAYEFKDSQQHFIANTYANDVVELQGTDGQMLAGQVRRTATQTFAGYIGDATFSKQKIEAARRDFLMFFRKKHYYTAVYVFSDGTAIQRDRGYIVNAPSVPELYQRFPEWSVGLNFEDPNYYEYAEDDLGHEIAAHKVELELSTAMSGGLIWDGDGAVSDDLSYVGTEIQGEGKNFQLADTGTATLKSAELLGDATQDGTPTPDAPQAVNTVTGEQTVRLTGKNLFDTNRTLGTPSNTAYTNTTPRTFNFTQYVKGISSNNYYAPNNITSFDVSNGNITLKTTQSAYGLGFAVPVLPSTTYRISYNVTPASGVASIGYYQKTGEWISNYTPNNSGVFITPANCAFIVVSFRGSGDNVETTYSNIMLELSTATAYEPYQGQTKTVNLGKNLLSLADGTTTTSGITATISNQMITLTGTTSESWGFNIKAGNNALPADIPAGSYTIVLNQTLTFPITLVLRSSDTTQYYSARIEAGNRTFTFSTNFEAHYYTLWCSATLGTTTNIQGLGVCLQKTGGSTTYAPYFTPIELAKIGNYQDRIYKTDGKWYIEKQVGKHIMASSDGWGWVANDKRAWTGVLSTLIKAPALDTAVDGLCDRFKASSFNQVNQQENVFAVYTTGTMSFRNSSWASLDDAQADVFGSIVYYALATPTTTEITNSALVGQLERLRHAHTYAGITNFSITATSPNLPAFLKVVAFGDDAIPQGGYVWEDGGTGGATTITVDGVDNAQPIWTVVGPATNPSLTNITTGESIQWTGVVPNGQTLVVNMADMTASLSGANVFEFISGSWITLQAGNNRVSYSATAATGIATLEWNGVVG